MGKNILISLAIILPVFAIISGPWFISLADIKWQGSYFPMWWAIGSFLALVVIPGATLIGYQTATNSDITKSKLWIRLFGN